METIETLSIAEKEKWWHPLTSRLMVPHDKAEYQQLVQWLDALIDEVGEDEHHFLASLMDVLAVLIERYENDNIPELQE